ncbi:zinc finger protein HD1-like isoform X2 [Carex littledalei]|uniref:Zinc finger protein HD1-like isoform X2 n=1 Tax=Carex littledalei TaxID=544730 RepID=A0A833QXG8_9POAL|nr:zinc finger protein HD1-like isoform X2 [Carex littledalei]
MEEERAARCPDHCPYCPYCQLPMLFFDPGIMNVVKENNEQDSEIFNEEKLDEYFDLAELDSCYEHFGDANHEGMLMPSHVMATATSSTGEVSTVGYSYTKSMGHSVSFSSLEASVVPDTTITDISNSHLLASNGTLDLVPGPAHLINLDLSAVDREARVMRYKEKRKMRKFEKILRYASRKAFAEARPRIKGRFAKRSALELEVDQMFAQSALSDHRVMRPCHGINDSKE